MFSQGKIDKFPKLILVREHCLYYMLEAPFNVCSEFVFLKGKEKRNWLCLWLAKSWFLLLAGLARRAPGRKVSTKWLTPARRSSWTQFLVRNAILNNKSYSYNSSHSKNFILLHFINLDDCDDAVFDDDADDDDDDAGDDYDDDDDADDDDDDDNDAQARRALRLTLPLLQLFLQPHAGHHHHHHSCQWNHDHNNPHQIHYHHLTCCQWGQCRHWQQACWAAHAWARWKGNHDDDDHSDDDDDDDCDDDDDFECYDDKVDPAMMAALMAACSVIQTGANTEEVNKILIPFLSMMRRWRRWFVQTGGERMKKCLFVFFMEGPGSGLCYLFLFIEVVPCHTKQPSSSWIGHSRSEKSVNLNSSKLRTLPPLTDLVFLFQHPMAR